jgi:hypothetical protein
LTKKQILISENYLNTAVPYNAAFMEQAVQSRDTTTMHKARLMKYLTEKTPEFQVNIYKANSSDCKSTYLAMIQTDKENVTTLTNCCKKHQKTTN